MSFLQNAVTKISARYLPPMLDEKLKADIILRNCEVNRFRGNRWRSARASMRHIMENRLE